MDDNIIYKTPLQEIKKYLNFPQLSSISNVYENYSEILPRLSKCFEIFLLSPATSVPSEKLFSHASFQVKNMDLFY